MTTVQKTVLIIDDTPANLGVLVDYLEQHDLCVVVAQDGEEGLMRAQFLHPDLILLDVMMPVLDGLETCRRLKDDARTHDIPVIFMTALGETRDKAAGFQAGGVDYITKPFQAEEVLMRLTTHLNLYHTTRQLQKTVAQLNQAHAELVRSETLAALGAMVAGIAHELNTPIGNGLLIASTLTDLSRSMTRDLKDGKGLTRSALEKYLNEANEVGDILQRNLERAGSLINSFKQVAVDRTSAQRRKFRLADVVTETVLLLSPTLKTTPYEVMHGIDHAIELDSFPGPLGQIITNLINNAVLHGFEGRSHGCIHISADIAPSGLLELTIADDGVGIPEAHLQRIFDPFFTTKMGAGGSGLGLYVCYNIATTVLNGQIQVSSAPGEGTRFLLTLPLKV
ncbi:response regulator [Duganella sp. FT92W]|uniref:histidine kinase n=1 Tax=Pseudoduganella rivuli TaxID=2666085 RepID=A0A7X2IIZ5_9BURK|nr:hybrid sensor histidine kinase/response regulator [Pseudoduganella rivuli]MRV70749.1 response regulator [Pseudoduganella rivuli]